jgi:hypothetical protein
MSAAHHLAPEAEWTGTTRTGGWRPDLGRAVADTSYVALRLSGWVLGTALASLGVFVLFFLMLGDFTPLGFFSHVGNLGTRFVTADEARRATFMGQVHVVQAVIFGLTALARWRLLLTILDPTKGRRHG